MRTLLVAAAAVAFASAAGAVTVTSSMGPDIGPNAFQHVVVDFDHPNATGYSFGPGIHTASSTSSGAAEPAGDTSTFGYVSSAFDPSSATLTTPKNLRSISFYWGSIDAYNSVDVLGAGGSTLLHVSGLLIPPASGNQSASDTNRRVNFVAGPGEAITGLRFNTSGVAFEFDTIAAGGVPEPTTWAMLVGGFGLVGVAARRRRPTVVAA